MIDITTLMGLIADSFFAGDTGIAGMVMFSIVMMVVFAMFMKKSLVVPFAMMLPITLIFTALKILPETMTILLIIVSVVGLAVTAKDQII